MLGSLGQPYSEAAETRMRLLIPPAQKSHCCISGDQREPWALDFSVYFLDVKEANGTFRRYPLKENRKEYSSGGSGLQQRPKLLRTGAASLTESAPGEALVSSLILLPPSTETGKGPKSPSHLDRQPGKHSATPREHGPSTHQGPVVCQPLSFRPSGCRRRGIIVRGKGIPGGGRSFP